MILFASDPQLIGIQDEHGFPVGAISRWDSDRFVLHFGLLDVLADFLFFESLIEWFH